VPRPSHVRDAVRRRLAAADRHSWSVDEMLEEVRAERVPADFSSIFRGLVWCESEGLVRRIEVGDGKARFELAGNHHEHARCERCGTVTEVPGCVVDDASVRLERITGFSIRAHTVLFTGLCRDCR
jgi:Fe2+ or Zn2+ uptake regulation protein